MTSTEVASSFVVSCLVLNDIEKAELFVLEGIIELSYVCEVVFSVVEI